MTLKSESHDVSVSKIIVRNDSDTLNKKGCEVNAVLMELCKEKNIHLIDNSKKIKLRHLNKGKLHLNQKGSRLLSDIFLKEISHVFNSQFRTENSGSEECISNLILKGKKIINCKSTLKTIRDDNLNKLIFAHLNINSIRNKFEELKGTVDVLMISETKIDDSFPIANFLIDSFSQPYRID